MTPLFIKNIKYGKHDGKWVCYDIDKCSLVTIHGWIFLRNANSFELVWSELGTESHKFVNKYSPGLVLGHDLGKVDYKLRNSISGHQFIWVTVSLGNGRTVTVQNFV